MPEEKHVLDIAVIIPFKDKAKMTLKCIETLTTHCPNIADILLISNNSSDSELDTIKQAIGIYSNVRVLEYNQPFNYQKMNNWSAKQTSAACMLILNNDTELTAASHDLIEEMHRKAHEPDVGMVGCLLLYGDEKTIQHAGVFIRPGLLGDHMYVGQSYAKALSSQDKEKFPYDIRKSRPMTAVTGAAQMIERKKFDAVKGFDERFIICGGDVDLCIRLNKAGFQTWYQAGGYIVHKESQSRAYKPVPYIDFYYSYQSYITGYDLEKGDPFLPKITEKMR